MDWKFTKRFILYLSLFLFIVQMPLDLLEELKVFTATVTADFWRAFSIPITHAGVEVRFFDFPMDITLECTALHYLSIYGAGVLAYRAHTPAYRLAGILFGTVSLFVLNVFRIGVLGLVGHYAAGLFEFIHAYLWQGAYALSVLLLWTAWVKGRSVFNRVIVRRIPLFFVSTFLSLWCLMELMARYATLLAAGSNFTFSVLESLTGLSIEASARAGIVAYASGDKVIYNKVSVEVLHASLFFGLVVAGASLARPVLFLKRVLAGAALLFSQQLLFVVLFGFILVHGMDGDAFAVLLWFTRGLSMSMPVLAWLLVTLVFRADEPLRKHEIADEASMQPGKIAEGVES